MMINLRGVPAAFQVETGRWRGWPEKKQNARNVEVVLFSLLLYYVNVCWCYIGPILILVPSGMMHLNH